MRALASVTLPGWPALPVRPPSRLPAVQQWKPRKRPVMQRSPGEAADDVALQAERKAARDARYAARKARPRKR